MKASLTNHTAIAENQLSPQISKMYDKSTVSLNRKEIVYREFDKKMDIGSEGEIKERE